MKEKKETVKGDGTRRGLWQLLRGILPQSARLAGAERTGVRGDSTSSRWLGVGLRVAQIEPTTLLAEPFASLLDFDALEREAEAVQQGATEPQTPLRATKGLQAFLKTDVTRPEALLLTAELSRLGSCRIVRPGHSGEDREGTGAMPLYLRLTESVLEVYFA